MDYRLPADSKYNVSQIIASDICGYEPQETSAKNDCYYELEDKFSKMGLIEDTANERNWNLLDFEAEAIYEFLENEESMTSNDRFHAFMNLPSHNN